MTAVRIAHISDPHLSTIPSWRDLSTTKRFFGRMNWLINRRRIHHEHLLKAAVTTILKDPPEAVILTGDLGQLGLAAEFESTGDLLSPLSRAGIPVYLVSGNHDYYGAQDQAAQCAFKELQKSLTVDNPPTPEGIVSFDNGNIQLLLLETGCPTPLFASGGHIRAEQIDQLRQTVSKQGAPALRIVAGHHPLLTAAGYRLPAQCGIDEPAILHQFLAEAHADLYLCGHIHHPFQVALSETCTQYCAGSITSSGRIHYIQSDGVQWNVTWESVI